MKSSTSFCLRVRAICQYLRRRKGEMQEGNWRKGRLPDILNDHNMSQRRALPRICIALGLPDITRLMEQARREAEAGENFLEFRLDYLPDPAAGACSIADFLKDYPNCTILATCRRHQNHGRFNGSIDDQLRILSMAIQCGARAIDIEIETAE